MIDASTLCRVVQGRGVLTPPQNFIREHVLVDGVRAPTQSLRIDPKRITIDGNTCHDKGAVLLRCGLQ